MKASAAMENLWLYLQSLPRSNKQWLADRLIEDLQPHVEEDRVEYISKEEILAGIAEGLRDVGRTRPFDEFMKEWEDEVQD